MKYEEYNACINILQKEREVFSEDDLRLKLECLETFRRKGTPSNIDALLPYLKDYNPAIRLRTAEVIVSLSDKVKSLNQLYDTLKYAQISIPVIRFYTASFQMDLSIKLLGIASLNHNGYVREKAVEILGRLKDPGAIPYLILRLGDWVINVREAAESAVKKFFVDEYREVFVNELVLIESLKNISRIDLTPQYESIIDYVVGTPLTAQFYNNLSGTEQSRLLYVKRYIERHGIDVNLIWILISDRSFLIRVQVLNLLSQFDDSKKKEVMLRLLGDKSSQVRLSALYHVKADAPSYYDLISDLTSDSSASVRDLARYLLRSNHPNFRDIYKKRIASGTNMVGSILGLAEVGTIEDLDVLLELLNTDDRKIKLACLMGISRVDLQQGRKYALQLLPEEPNKIRKRCIDILSRSWDPEVMLETERLYANGDTALKKSIQTLYNSVGGWDVLGFLIRAVSEDDRELSDLAWYFLQRWREKALRLFTNPPRESIERAKSYYENGPRSISGSDREWLWGEIGYYLRR